MGEFHYTVINLSFGDVGLIWAGDDCLHLIKVMLPDCNLPVVSLIQQSFPASTPHAHAKIDEICHRLALYDQGQEVTFPCENLAWNGWSAFYRTVWREAYKIPIGKVITYGQLARNIFSPRSARAVGTALSRNPFPLIIPCHRIVRSTGELGGYSSGGTIRKHQLLEKEGVLFDHHGRVSFKPSPEKQDS